MKITDVNLLCPLSPVLPAVQHLRQADWQRVQKKQTILVYDEPGFAIALRFVRLTQSNRTPDSFESISMKTSVVQTVIVPHSHALLIEGLQNTS